MGDVTLPATGVFIVSGFREHLGTGPVGHDEAPVGPPVVVARPQRQHDELVVVGAGEDQR